MAIKDKIIDISAANQLNISITTITPAQAWKRQVRGVYSLIYLYAQQDFVHIKDFQQWIRTTWKPHTHTNGNNGNPTGPPIQPSIYTDTFAKALLLPVIALGAIRRGILEAPQLIADFFRTSKDRKLRGE